MVQWKIPKPALADIKVLPAVNKARRPKFELHLKIYDLNNVPLVTGLSQIKWHLPHSIHGDHRGRTTKAPIVNHRVEYHYSRVVPVRIAIDRNNNLSECPIEFEVLQEFDSGGVAGHVEKIVLGKVTLNLAEYVEESEAIVRELRPGTAEGPQSRGHARHRSSLSAHTGGTSRSSLDRDEALSAMDAEEGVVRRYLMQESKVNSTLKIGILMVQIEGERNYIAPALKTAPVFGGIAGIMAGEQVEQDDAGQLPNLSKSRDASEVQDMYRRALAASWACQPGDMPADECIEDIFGGGSGFRDPLYTTAAAATSSPRGAAAPPTMTTTAATGASSSDTASTASSSPRSRGPPHGRSRSNLLARDDSGSDEFEGVGGGGGSTLRPRDARLFQQRQQQQQQHQQQQGLHHSRQHSGGSLHTVTHRPASRSSQQRPPSRSRDETLSVRVPSGGPASSSVTGGGGGGSLRSSESMASLATTLGSDRGREGFKRPSEVGEFEVRDDLVAWRLPGAVS